MYRKVAVVLTAVVLVLFYGCSSGEPYRLHVTIVQPEDGDTLRGVVRLRAETSGNDPVVRVDFFISDSLNNDSLIGYVRNQPFELSWDTRNFEDGRYTLFAEARGLHIEARSGNVEIFIANNLGIEPPSNLTLVAAGNGELVQISWSKVDSADGYHLYFKATDDTTWNTIYVAQGVDDTIYIHDPNSRTGYYRVSAYRGTNESRPSQIVSTVPIETDPLTICDVNWDNVAGYYSGYGWSRTDGFGDFYSMLFPANSAFVDFYFTNFQYDRNTPPFYFASPQFARHTIDSLVVRESDWRANGLQWVDLQTAMSVLPDAGYADSVQAVDDAYYAVKTVDGYYGLIQVESLDRDNGLLTIRTWFQKVHGLRLFQR